MTHFVRLRVLLLLCTCGCGQERDEVAARRAATAQSLAAHVVPAMYGQLRADAALLATGAEDLCAAPDAARLTAVRDAWSETRGAWTRSEVVVFGPVEAYPERLGPKLDSFPTDAEGLQALVDGDDALDQAGFDARGSRLRGLPALEHVLYADGDGTLDALSSDPRRCMLLTGLAADIAENSSRLWEAWNTGWADPDAPRDDMHDSARELLDAWVNAMLFSVENVRAKQLGKPLGDATGGQPQPDLLQSRPSERSLQDAQDAVWGVGALWRGYVATDSEAHPGIRDAVRDAELVDAIDAAFEAIDASLGEIDEPLEAAIVDDRDDVVLAQDALRALQVALQVELAQDLAVTITFNDNDGD